MNAPRPMATAHPLVAEALGRLARIGTRAGHADWLPPALVLDGAALDRLCDRHALPPGERLVVALLAAIECDAAVARRMADLQAPVGGPRLLAGLAAALAAAEGLSVAALTGGVAARAGLLTLGAEAAPLPERSLAMPDWLACVLGGGDALPPGVRPLPGPPLPLTQRVDAELAALATMLGDATDRPLPVLRAACPAEARAMAAALAQHAGLRAMLLDAPPLPGLAAWLELTRSLAVIALDLGPGEVRDLGPFAGLDAPAVVVTGPAGQLLDARRVRDYRAVIPDEAERAQLWQGWGFDAPTAALVAARYRQSAGRIAELGRALDPSSQPPSVEQLRAVMQQGNGRIDALARRAEVRVARADIVLPPTLADALDRLRDRILMRNRLHETLGPTIRARYLPGVRALLTGESGTGKTLAAHWLAGEAGLPLYRVDLSALTSKWIGETEKNLSQLLDAAEAGDVLLFFDEADALFGARTDVADAHDRHANAQTNFLLQRIEDYAGVALLATNSRDRFDPAFVRRLDMVLEFPLPDGAARRALWDRHLGDGHAIDAARLDHVAAQVDLAGGHVRNVVLAAAARAAAAALPISAAHLDAAIAEEYAKLGRTAPPL